MGQWCYPVKLRMNPLFSKGFRAMLKLAENIQQPIEMFGNYLIFYVVKNIVRDFSMYDRT